MNFKNIYKKLNNEVFYNIKTLCTYSKHDSKYLKHYANISSKQRSRLCAHNSTDELLHEMFILHKRNIYVRPHKHVNRTESILIMEGKADIILFNNKGIIDNVIKLGNYASGLNCYLRINPSIFHSLIVKSKYVIFLETTTGPFKVKDTVYGNWSPEILDYKGTKEYIKLLYKNLDY